MCWRGVVMKHVLVGCLSTCHVVRRCLFHPLVSIVSTLCVFITMIIVVSNGSRCVDECNSSEFLEAGHKHGG